MSPESKVIWILQLTLICPTIPLNTYQQSHAGGTLLYISNNIAYNPRKDLNIYKTHELESTFIEIFNPKKSNIILGVVYQHRTMDLNEFNDKYVNELLLLLLLLLLDNIKENKTTFLPGDFNIDLLKYDDHTSANNFWILSPPI